jgi:hypothetical protein
MPGALTSNLAWEKKGTDRPFDIGATYRSDLRYVNLAEPMALLKAGRTSFKAMASKRRTVQTWDEVHLYK